MEEKTVRLPDISCGHCVATIQRELGELQGVEVVEADADTKNATLRWQPPATWSQISSLLDEIGFPVAA